MRGTHATEEVNFFNARVILLQALHRAMSVPCGGDALDGVVGTGEGRDVRNLVLDGSLTDGGFIGNSVAASPRGVDDEVHLLVQDDIQNVRAAFGKTLQARVAGKLACA